MEWYIGVLKKFAEFEGRSRRKEFWMFALINFGISFGLSIIDTVTGLSQMLGGIGPLSTLYGLAVLVPGIAVSIRRLHDTNRTGLWILLAFTCVGVFVLIAFYAMEGDRGSNQYGADPKAGSAD